MVNNNKIIIYSSSFVAWQSFTVFPEYFLSLSIFYVLIVIVLISYNISILLFQKSLNECFVLILIMIVILLINDDLLVTQI